MPGQPCNDPNSVLPAWWTGVPQSSPLCGRHAPLPMELWPPRARNPDITQGPPEKVHPSGLALRHLESAKASGPRGATSRVPRFGCLGSRRTAAPGLCRQDYFLLSTRPDCPSASPGAEQRWGVGTRGGGLLMAQAHLAHRPPLHLRPPPRTRSHPSFAGRRPRPRGTEEPCESVHHPFIFSNWDLGCLEI